MGELLDGDVQENDPAARESLSSAMALASLGPDDALALLYELAKYRPRSKPDDLFGIEKGTLLRQLGLYKRESDRGVVGRSTALAHLDIVAERIVRAAGLRLGSSEPLKARIQASPRDPDYGARATASVGCTRSAQMRRRCRIRASRHLTRVGKLRWKASPTPRMCASRRLMRRPPPSRRATALSFIVHALWIR
jgi:hypothetical protein